MVGIKAAITDRDLDVTGAIADAADPECGGLAVFLGTVRASASAAGRDNESVVRLEYEAHPKLATERLRAIGEQAASKWDIRRVVAVHRTGICELGEPTVVVVCAAAHRADALDACRWMIDEIKATVPIWKREVYASGASWVGAEGES